MEWLRRVYKTKTFKVAVGGILTAVGGYLTGHLTGVELIVALFGAWELVNIRDAIAKK